MIVFPNPYHSPPAPTRLDNRTLVASALSALRTRELNGGGMLNSAQSLCGPLTKSEKHSWWCHVRIDNGIREPNRYLHLAEDGNLEDASAAVAKTRRRVEIDVTYIAFSASAQMPHIGDLVLERALNLLRRRIYQNMLGDCRY